METREIPFKAIDRAFVYNAIDDRWEENNVWNGNIVSEKNLCNLPLSLIFGCSENNRNSNKSIRKLWCEKHHDYEEIDVERRTSSRGCSINDLQLPIAKTPERLKILGEYVPLRWRVYQEEPDGKIIISVDVIIVHTRQQFIWQNLKNVLVPDLTFKYAEYVIDMKNKTRAFSPTDPSESWRLDNYNMRVPSSVPKIAIRAAIECLQQTAMVLYGKCFSIGENNWDFFSIWDAVLYPFDLNICWMRYFIGYKIFNNLFSPECPDNYHTLCQYLELKPPKGIKKLYQDNPWIIIFYMWLCRVGFLDINAIRLFFVPEIMRRIHFDNVYFDPVEKLIHNFSLPFTNSGMDFVFYVRWMIKNGKDEMALARQLIKILSEGWGRDHDDMLKMFHENYPFLSEETKQLIKRRGICEDTHDTLAEETNSYNIRACQMHYNEDILTLSDTVRGYNFKIIDNTIDLPKIGRILRNCVASYSERVRSGYILIVIAENESEVAACIEVTVKKGTDKKYDFSIVQALGKYNRMLSGEILLACREWAEQNNIAICTSDLNIREEAE